MSALDRWRTTRPSTFLPARPASPRRFCTATRALCHACHTEQNHHGQTTGRRVPLHPAALSHRRENALVRQPALREHRRCCSRGVKPEWILRDGHGGARAPSCGCSCRGRRISSTRSTAGDDRRSRDYQPRPVAADAHRRAAGAAEPDQAVAARFSRTTSTTPTTALANRIGPGCVHLGLDNIDKVGAIGKAGYGWQTRDRRRAGPRRSTPGEVGELCRQGPRRHALLLQRPGGNR